MPTRKLTDLWIERQLKAPASGRVEYFDTLQRGLALRVTGNGVRTWCVFYRVRGRLRRFTIGTWPTYKVKAARKAGGDAIRKAAEGGDPSADKRAAREAPDHERIFEAVAERYLRHAKTREKPLRPKSYKEWKRILDVDVAPRWGKRPVAEITKRDVLSLIDGIAERGAPIQANRVLARLKTFFNWCVAKDIIAASPMAGLRPGAEAARDRALGDDELRWLWQACDAIGEPFGPLFKILALTAQRKDEVGGMRWSELDLEKRVWTIPRERAKSDRAHLVQLSADVVAIIEKLTRIEKSPYVFTTSGETPVSGFSRAKARLDEEMRKARRRELGLPVEDDALREALGLKPEDPLPAEIEPFIIHDLRRTATTGMARLKFPPQVVDKILNHSSGTIRGVAAIYNRFEYEDDRRDALAAWAHRLKEIVENRPAPDNVRRIRA